MSLREHEARIRRWAEEGKTDTWIAEELGSKVPSVQSFRRRNGIDKRYRRGRPDPVQVAAWVGDGESDDAIGRRLGMTAHSVASFRSRHGILRPSAWDDEAERRVRAWVRQGRTSGWIARQLGTTEASVASFKKRRNIKAGRVDFLAREEDVRRWVDEGRSDRWISDRLGSRPGDVAAFRLRRRILRPAGGGRKGQKARDDETDSNAEVLRRNEENVLAAVGPGGVEGYGELRRRTGLGEKTLRKHLKALAERGLVEVEAGGDGRPMRAVQKPVAQRAT